MSNVEQFYELIRMGIRSTLYIMISQHAVRHEKFGCAVPRERVALAGDRKMTR